MKKLLKDASLASLGLVLLIFYTISIHQLLGRRHLDPGRIQLSRVGSIVGFYHYPIRGRGSSYVSQSEAGILLLGVFGLILIPGAGIRICSKESNVLHLHILNIEFNKIFSISNYIVSTFSCSLRVFQGSVMCGVTQHHRAAPVRFRSFQMRVTPDN